MRRSVAAAALIRQEQGDEVLWLARWSGSWHRYHLVGGHKRPEESFRECLVREIGEELGLEEHRDFTMAAEPVTHLEFVAWSEGAQEETAYTTELFEVQLHDGPTRAKVDAKPENRWLSEAEIRRGQSADGKPVSDTMKLLLSKIDWGRQ